jgi:DNA (cytosine-5)-methyltransferase 1
MRHGSLFSGIGGFDLAAEWMGWENVFHCEWMEFPRKVLEYYWPEADSHIDICKTDFKKYANTIDILTGGFPCQPFSLAGKRKGTDDERYLWHEMLRAIREIKPKWVIAENVFGIVNIDGGMVFEQVCVDLENEGYEVQPYIIPAAAKNAPHRRDRVWFIAQNTNCIRLDDGKINTGGRGNRKFEPTSNKCQIDKTFRNATNTENIGQKYALENRELEGRRFRFGNQSHTWSSFPLEPPICGGDDGLPTELDGITFSKWRNESIKGYGNAIVPQIAYQLFQIIENESKNKNT